MPAGVECPVGIRRFGQISKVLIMIIRRMFGAGVLFVVSALFADFSQLAAQQPQQVRLRGTLEALDGTLLTVKARDGSEVKVKLTDNYSVGAMIKKELSDVTVGSFVGVAAMPQSDGSQKAISVSIFPESARGAGEGFRPWDARPNSTMTNATVSDSIAANDGQTLTVKYKDGEKKIIITPETQITTTVAGDRSELKPGIPVMIFATKQPDGSVTASRVTIGRGLTPAS